MVSYNELKQQFCNFLTRREENTFIFLLKLFTIGLGFIVLAGMVITIFAVVTQLIGVWIWWGIVAVGVCFLLGLVIWSVLTM